MTSRKPRQSGLDLKFQTLARVAVRVSELGAEIGKREAAIREYVTERLARKDIEVEKLKGQVADLRSEIRELRKKLKAARR